MKTVQFEIRPGSVAGFPDLQTGSVLENMLNAGANTSALYIEAGGTDEEVLNGHRNVWRIHFTEPFADENYILESDVAGLVFGVDIEDADADLRFVKNRFACDVSALFDGTILPNISGTLKGN